MLKIKAGQGERLLSPCMCLLFYWEQKGETGDTMTDLRMAKAERSLHPAPLFVR